MNRSLTPQAFLTALRTNFGVKLALAVFTIPGWLLPFACLVVWGVPERVIVPILLAGLLPFQYGCYCVFQIVVRPMAERTKTIDLVQVIGDSPEFRAAISGFVTQANAVLREAERQRFHAAPPDLSSALMSVLLGGLTPAEAIRRQRALIERPGALAQLESMSAWHRQQLKPDPVPSQAPMWEPHRPQMSSTARA